MAVYPSQIDAVTVYHQGATVRRTIELKPQDGTLEPEVKIPGLPLALIDASVKVRVLKIEPESAELSAREVRVGLYVAPKDTLPEPPEAKEERETNRAIETHQSQIDQLESEISLLGAMHVPERPEGEEGKPPPPSPLSARLALEGFVDARVLERVKEIRALREGLEKLYERKAELEDQRMRASRAKRAEASELTKTVVAHLHQGTERLERAQLQLEYFVPGARWAPAYQCRLDREGTKASIQLRAMIVQKTGEDWKNVRLSLSTAAPMRWTELPQLDAIRIGKAQPTPPERRGFRPPPLGGSKLFSDFDQGKRFAGSLAPRPLKWSPPRLEMERSALRLQRVQDPVPALSSLRSIEQASERWAANELPVGGAAFDEDEGTAAEIQLSAMPSEMPVLAEEAPAPRRAKRAPRPEAARKPAAPPPPPTSKVLRRIDPEPLKKAIAREKGGGPGGPPPIPSAGAAEALVFGQLSLGAPQDINRRGKLEPIDRAAQYRATLEQSGLEVALDVVALVERATELARTAAQVALPSGAIDVRHAAGRFDYAYEADAPVDVPANGLFHSIPLGVRESPSQMRYVVVPREDTSVFRSTSLENPTEAPLLAGPAEVYVGGEYVLTTQLPEVPPAGRFSLGLGVEQGIKCARNTRFSEARTSEKVVATNRLVHEIEIEIRNNLGRAIDCEVRERVPQPHEDAEVVVEETAVEPAWERYNQADRSAPVAGGRRWKISIDALSKKTLKAQYEVKIYANNELVGGNRREA